MSEDWRNDPATEKQREKLSFFGCTWDEGITKGQASDAIEECVKSFPETQRAWLNRPATFEQLEELRSYGEESEPNLTYGEAKELLRYPGSHHAIYQPEVVTVADSKTEVSKRGFFAWVSGKLAERKARIEEARAQRKAYIAGIISDLKNGKSRYAEFSNFVQQRGELICWIEAGSLEKIKVVGRHYEGGSAGVSFRLAKGVRFNVGRSRGNIVSDKAVVTTSTGHLLVTNKRLVFLGNEKSLTIKLDKLLEVHPALYGVKFSDGTRSGPKLVRYQNKNNGDIVCEVLNYVMGY